MKLFQFAKRITIFIVINALIMVTLSIVLSLLGIGVGDTGTSLRRYGTGQLDLGTLLIYSLVYGMTVSFISLAISRMMAKWMMGVKVISPDVRDPQLQWLVRTVHQMAKRSGINTMPEVGLYESPEVNAFATGPTKNRALVAVSSGLLNRMTQEEVEGVLAHEVAHVVNGDMVTMTLVQGVVNAFVIFFSRIVASIISQNVKDEARPIVYMVSRIVFEIGFMFLGMFVVAYYSRIREFRADEGGAKLAGKDKMINALRRLKNNTELVDNSQQAIAAFKISSGKGGILSLLSTHPSLDLRISRLERARI